MNIHIPGLRNSNSEHWQSCWEEQFPNEFKRVNQENWANPERVSWVTQIEDSLQKFDLKDVVLIGHSVGCASILHWYKTYQKKVKGVLLVAPSDVDHPKYPKYISGFSPMPIHKLPFPSTVVYSSNDTVVTSDRAKYFANQWGSKCVELKNAGHIEGASGYVKWDYGLELIKELREGKITLPK